MRVVSAASSVTLLDRQDDGAAAASVQLLAYAAIGLLILSAPFEAAQPLLRLPGQSVSNVEGAIALALVTSGAAYAITPQTALFRRTLLAPWLAFCMAAVIAAAFAPEQRSNATRMALRLWLAGGVYAATLVAVRGRERVGRAMEWIVIAGGIVSVVALLEYLEVPFVLTALTTFRPAVALVGAQVRAAGPLQYPTIASMILEVCFACGLGVLARAQIEQRRVVVRVLLVTLVVIGEGIVVTFTRSGLITAAVSILIVASLVGAKHGRRAMAPFAWLAVIGAFEIAGSRSNEVIGARLASEGQEGWYRARIDAPSTISLAPGQSIGVPIQLTNEGRITWSSDVAQPFRVSYHWLEADSARVVEWEGVRTLLPQPVAPGDSLSLTASLRAPAAPGQYRLIWDIEQTDRLWFSTEPDAQLIETEASVAGVAVGPRRSSGSFFMPTRAVRPGRRVLWGAAARMLVAHPFAGVGPDNYRLLYGRHASLPGADARVHSNNTYIELIVGTGLIGAVALLWVAKRLMAIVASAVRADDPLATGLVAACGAIAVHGLADSFLGFTPTYAVMAIALGLLTLIARSGGTHADRV